MDKQKLLSFFFDFTGMDLDKLLEGLGIDEKLEPQKIQNAVNDFEKYILERHGENPSYEGIAKFWKENQVSEELIKIRYNLNSKYKDYEEFKNHLKTMFSSQDFNSVLFFEVMDEFEKCLSDTISNLSTLSKSDVALHKKFHEDTRDEIASLLEQSSKQYQALLEVIKQVQSPDISDFDWYFEAVELEGRFVKCYELKSQYKDLVLKDVKFWYVNKLRKETLEGEIDRALTWIGLIEHNIKIIDESSEMGMLKILGDKHVTLYQKSDYRNMKMCFERLSFREHYLQSKAIFEDLFSDGISDKWIVTNKAEIGDIKVGSKLSDTDVEGFKKFYTLDCVGGPAQLVNDFFYKGKSLLVIEGTFKGNKIYTVFDFTTLGQANTRNLIPSRYKALSDEDDEIIELIENSIKKGLSYDLDDIITYSHLSNMKRYFIEPLD
jgi:hypothetical protein